MGLRCLSLGKLISSCGVREMLTESVAGRYLPSVVVKGISRAATVSVPPTSTAVVQAAANRRSIADLTCWLSRAAPEALPARIHLHDRQPSPIPTRGSMATITYRMISSRARTDIFTPVVEVHGH